MIYRGRGAFINIGKAKDNFNKNRRPKCFNCNTYRYIAKKYQKPKRERETRKYYKYNKVRYFAKGCRSGQKMKNKSIQTKKATISKSVLLEVWSRYNIINLYI